MYLDHFKLTDLPFRLSPDPAFLYLSQIHARAKAYMESTILETSASRAPTASTAPGLTSN